MGVREQLNEHGGCFDAPRLRGGGRLTRTVVDSVATVPAISCSGGVSSVDSARCLMAVIKCYYSHLFSHQNN